MNSDRRSQQGFSLLEVLVAFALSSLFFSVMLPVAVTSLDRLLDTQQRSSALAIARSTLEKHSVIARFEEGVFEGRESGFSWKASISRLPLGPIEASTGLFALRTIRVDVSKEDAVPVITLATYQLGDVQ